MLALSEQQDEAGVAIDPHEGASQDDQELSTGETVEEGYVLLRPPTPVAPSIDHDDNVFDNPVIVDAVAPSEHQDARALLEPITYTEAPLPPVAQEEVRASSPTRPEGETAERETVVSTVAPQPATGGNRKKRLEPALRVRRIPMEAGWEDRVATVMDRDKPQGVATPIGVVMDLSSAVSVELVEDRTAIEIKGAEWQNLQEAEALIRLLFRDYREGYSWWFYSVPSFSALCISNTIGTSVPELSDEEGKGLRVSIAPYDENATRRAFFITCPTNGPVDEAYRIIKEGWNYWREQQLEMQINRVMGILYNVHIRNIKPDGNCLFRAFAVAQLDDEEAHMEVRKAVVDFMRGSDELRSFIAIDDDAEDDPDFVEKYLAEMEKATTWGDQVEITAFTRVYKRPVRVFSYNFHESRLVNVYTATENAEEDLGPEVKLLHMWGHYSLLTEGVADLNVRWNISGTATEEQKGEAPALPLNDGEEERQAQTDEEEEENNSLEPQRGRSSSSLEGLRQEEELREENHRHGALPSLE